jgi:hypothetical protein
MRRLVDLWQQFQQATLSVARVRDIMNALAEPYSLVPGRVRSGRGLVETEDLSFKYREGLPLLLKGLNLNVEPGRVVAFFALAIASLMTGCGSAPQNSQVENGWVTNCKGTQFDKFTRPRGDGPGPSRPVFKVNDQLVLAVPAVNVPSAGRIENGPQVCRSIADLPSVPYLYFVIQGDWSGVYNPQDIPLENGNRQFQPDAVTVRVEREPPSTLSVDDQRKIDESVHKVWHDDIRDPQEIDGLICGKIEQAAPNSSKGGMLCSGQRSPSDPDEIRFDTHSYRITPFLLLQADYKSSHYGGIHIYWQVWTLGISHGREIDRAIWKSLTEWNLVDESIATVSQR